MDSGSGAVTGVTSMPDDGADVGKVSMDVPGYLKYSSYRENLLEHLVIAEIMRELWRDGYKRVEVLKSEVDDSGYDLVLETNAIVRHVQLKSSHVGSATASVNISLALAQKPSGCVIWTWFDMETVELQHYLWLGSGPGEPLPDLLDFKIPKAAKANALGIKASKPGQRTVPKGKFEVVQRTEDLVDKLFGTYSPDQKP